MLAGLFHVILTENKCSGIFAKGCVNCACLTKGVFSYLAYPTKSDFAL
jgi:hypothetical protein